MVRTVLKREPHDKQAAVYLAPLLGSFGDTMVRTALKRELLRAVRIERRIERKNRKKRKGKEKRSSQCYKK